MLLHKKQFRKTVTENDDYINEIRREYKLGTTANIKTEDNINRMLSQIKIEDVKTAIINAQEIMNNKLESDKIYVRRNFSYYNNPSMSIHEFLAELFSELNIK